jgi:hypothetical protein
MVAAQPDFFFRLAKRGDDGVVELFRFGSPTREADLPGMVVQVAQASFSLMRADLPLR